MIKHPTGKIKVYYNACRNRQSTQVEHIRHDNKVSIGAYTRFKTALKRKMRYFAGPAMRALWKPSNRARIVFSSALLAESPPKHCIAKCHPSPPYGFELQKYGKGGLGKKSAYPPVAEVSSLFDSFLCMIAHLVGSLSTIPNIWWKGRFMAFP